MGAKPPKGNGARCPADGVDSPWLDREIIQAEAEIHGSLPKAAAAHGGSNGTWQQAWVRHGLPPRRRGPAPTISGYDILDAVSREEILQQEIRELRSAAVRDRTRDVMDERLFELVREKIDAKRLRYQPAKRGKRAGSTPHRFVLEWSDLHACEVVDEEAMGGLNRYDWDVMLRRHDKILDGVLSYRENRPYPVEGLHVWGLGDMVTGDIHDELRITNEKVLTEGTIQLGMDMADWVETLIPEFPWLRIDAVFGNHGRRSKKPQFKQAYDNWDWLFYKILEVRLAKYPSVTINVSKAATLPVKVFDRNELLWHGDGVPTNMPGVPWGGILRRTKELSDTHTKLGRTIDHFAVGHYHEPNVVANGRVLMNGSVKGQDEYALARFGGGAPAAQNLFTFHPGNGLVEFCRIDLADIR